LYGVTAFLVTQRTREIGIRVALGANRKHIITDVLGGGLKLTAIGIVIGGIASAMTAKLFKSLMYGVTAVDASVYVTTIGLLVVVAIIACILPARKATKVDPASAFRAT
jgi:ABC-type antimicrobial peptide transport system permease subunit